MPVQPVGHALAEWIVVQVAGTFSHRAVRNRNWIHETFVAHLRRTKQAHVVRGSLDMLEPASSPKVAAPHSKRNLVCRILHGLVDACGKLLRHALVRVHVENPLMSE